MTTSLESLYLVETVERIFIHNSEFHKGDSFVVINRITDEITISHDHNIIPADPDRLRTIAICGIIGVIRLVAGKYLVYMKSRERVGDIAGRHAIWKLNQFDIIPFKRSLLHLTEKQVQYNNTYLEMVNTVLNTPNFYYSNTYDLSHNMQDLDSKSPDFLKDTLVERADNRFVWNSSLLENFHQRQKELHPFCVPIIHGFVGSITTQLNNEILKFILISRRSIRRPGTRLFSRGIDGDGNVSNFVETEQIVEHGRDISSFVQIRGSVPLFWTQKPNLRYKPPPKLTNDMNHAQAFDLHFDDLIAKYEAITSVNLVNQTGSEAVLELGFRENANRTSISNTTYEAFDFHRECHHMNWARLEVLVNRLTHNIEQYGYFFRGSTQKDQAGVFRTNCVDCLDRTNVVQGLLARVNLEHVLRQMSVFRDNEKISNHSEFEHLVKNIWADNGDNISIQYSGTGALKTDFTRTGKRTILGVLRDGYNSGMRYFLNNHADGFRQDALNLFAGNYIVTEEEGQQKKSPLENRRNWKHGILPMLFFLSIGLFVYVTLTTFPNYTTEYLLYMLFWGSMTFATGGVIMYFGTEYVDNPVLNVSPQLIM